MGATLLTEVEVCRVHVDHDRVRAVETPAGTVQTGALVNATGPFAADVGHMLGLDLPIWPLRRQMLVTTPLLWVPADLPFIIDLVTGL